MVEGAEEQEHEQEQVQEVRKKNGAQQSGGSQLQPQNYILMFYNIVQNSKNASALCE